MSSFFSVYVGPFAEWLVPILEYRKVSEKWQAFVEEFLLSEKGSLDLDHNAYTREVKVGQQRFIRECWTAYFGLARGAIPPRKFHWDSFGDVGEWEFSGFAFEEEKQWFQETFAQQLKQLAGAYGDEPTIKWGVVAKYS